MSGLTPRQQTIHNRIAAGLPFGRGRRADLDQVIEDRLVDHWPVSHIAKALRCHPRLVRRIRDRLTPGREA